MLVSLVTLIKLPSGSTFNISRAWRSTSNSISRLQPAQAGTQHILYAMPLPLCTSRRSVDQKFHPLLEPQNNTPVYNFLNISS